MEQDEEIYEGGKRGKKVVIKWADMEQLCFMHCTLEEVAFWFKCNSKTIERVIKKVHKLTWKEYFDKYSSGGKLSLRRLQYQRAQAGSDKMLIHLGKNWLGQREKVDITSGGQELEMPPAVIISADDEDEDSEPS